MKNKEFKVVVEDYNVPLFPWSILINQTFQKDMLNQTKGRIKVDSILFFEKDYTYWAPNLKHFISAEKYYNERLWSDQNFSSQICKDHNLYLQKIKKFASWLLSENLFNKTNKQLYDVYLKGVKNYADIWLSSMAIQYSEMGDNIFSERVKQFLLPKLKKIGSPDVVFSKIISPLRENLIAKENKEALNLLKLIQSNNKLSAEFKRSSAFNVLSSFLQKKIKILEKKFGWLQFYYFGPPASADYYFYLIKDKLNVNAKKQLAKINAEKKKLIDYKKRCRNYFTSREWQLMNVLSDFLYFKEARKEIQIYLLSFAMHKWFCEFAKRFGFSPLQARYILPNEYKNILVFNKKPLSADMLNKRYQKSAYFIISGEEKIVLGKNSDSLKRRHLIEQKIDKNIKEIKGTVAFSGKVSGKVKIVNSVGDLHKFIKGEILVSISTNPSLIAAMNKAGAIVTDTGGVTCHAAIVSRELRIPCIIGTKIATKVLKDGDLVEVNATLGTVEKIN